MTYIPKKKIIRISRKSEVDTEVFVRIRKSSGISDSKHPMGEAIYNLLQIFAEIKISDNVQ